jgi:hypothetical protein
MALPVVKSKEARLTETDDIIAVIVVTIRAKT